MEVGVWQIEMAGIFSVSVASLCASAKGSDTACFLYVVRDRVLYDSPIASFYLMVMRSVLYYLLSETCSAHL